MSQVVATTRAVPSRGIPRCSSQPRGVTDGMVYPQNLRGCRILEAGHTMDVVYVVVDHRDWSVSVTVGREEETKAGIVVLE